MLKEDKLYYTPGAEPHGFAGLSFAPALIDVLAANAVVIYENGDKSSYNIRKRHLVDRYFLIGILPDDVPADAQFLTSSVMHIKALKQSLQRSGNRIEKIEFEFRTVSGAHEMALSGLMNNLKVLVRDGHQCKQGDDLPG